MSTKPIFIIILGIAICVACASPGKDSAERTVNRFIEGLYAKDADTVGRAAPFFGEIEEKQKQQLYDTVQTFDSWEIENVKVKGSSAIVLVEFSKSDSQVQMQFPLKARKDSWVIQETLSFSTTIDIIPAE